MDNILFSSRLKALRIAAGYTTQNQFARAYNEKYPPKRRDEAGGNEGNYGGILGTIKNYENENWSGRHTLEIILNMCEMLNCDIDYLLGRINHETHVKEMICEATKLSGGAVDLLLNDKSPYHSDYISSLNFLLKSENFKNALSEIPRYYELKKTVSELREKQLASLPDIAEYTPNSSLLQVMENAETEANLCELRIRDCFGFTITELNRFTQENK